MLTETSLLDMGQCLRLYKFWGIDGVIPIRFKEKKPLVPKWESYQRRRATQAELRQWFKPGVSMNVAIICGPVNGNLVVLDFDPEASELYEGFCEFCQSYFNKPLVEVTPIVLSGRGGHHVYWRVKQLPQLFHPVGEQRKSLPDIQSTGGYVLAPPSVHPNGNAYRWLNPTLKQISTIDSLSDLALDVPLAGKKQASLANEERVGHSRDELYTLLTTPLQVGERHRGMMIITCHLIEIGVSEQVARPLVKCWVRQNSVEQLTDKAIDIYLDDLFTRYHPSGRRWGAQERPKRYAHQGGISNE